MLCHALHPLVYLVATFLLGRFKRRRPLASGLCGISCTMQTTQNQFPSIVFCLCISICLMPGSDLKKCAPLGVENNAQETGGNFIACSLGASMMHHKCQAYTKHPQPWPTLRKHLVKNARSYPTISQKHFNGADLT